ncbi:class I SAM-dependent methyltransferase [Ottowia thiooxydans]|uniref:class I SAM-dependent methyltransferase n=1 Tax=Ottowia thiooxydans TaxID=219182 RepID=UPI00146DB061|nr:class I SAM-dependent methyltransferase [Ottowia thiooxydans]
MNDTKQVAAWVKSHATGTVLDIGCANRWIERHLVSGTRYIGLDYWETGKNLYEARPDIFADAACLPMAAQSCDTVILLEVLEHIKTPQEALQETSRVLRPGGHLLLSMPFLYPIHDAPHDYQRLTKHGLERDLANAGLEIVSIEQKQSSLESAAVLACLALGGATVQSLRQRKASVVFIPVLLILIALVNILGWTAARIFPNWAALTTGYRLLARKAATP